MPVSNRHAREQWLTRREYVNVDAIVGAAEHEGVLVPRAVALVTNETATGRNIYSDSEGPSELRGQLVTEKNFQAVIEPWHHGTGGETGIGPYQLTSWDLVEEANRLGGVWNAYCSAQVALHLFHELVGEHGVYWAAAAYNGGPGWATSPGAGAAERYAERFQATERRLLAEGLS